MKKIIAILFTVHCSLFTLHELYAQSVSDPIISHSVAYFESMPIREMRIVIPGDHQEEKVADLNRFGQIPEKAPTPPDQADKQVLQKTQGHRQGRGPLLNFEGIGNVNDFFTADPNGDVGLDHYVQTVNNSFAIWDKHGNLLYGPADNKTIWSSFPGPWNTDFWSDPVFKYDQLADRWIISSIAVADNLEDYYTMIAVSVTSDPLGTYYCYAYHFTALNDYPKISIWPDGYYMSHNFWDMEADTFLYTHYSVVDRDAMLNGDSVSDMIQFQVVDAGEWILFPLPADLRGMTIPANTPCYFAKLGRHEPGNPWHLSLDVHAFDTDWNTPANSTFEQITQFDLGQFEPVPYPYGPGSPQMGSDINVNTIPLYLMYPLTYRMFSDHEALVCCQTMWDGEIHYIKWYELRKETSGWYIYQTGNYAPGDAHYFFPSISISGNGDMALGYSVCSGEMYPSIRYTGRRAGDSLGIMTFEEIELYKGLNYANTYLAVVQMNRWGDYSSMMTDPSDDSTFWYTNMYTTGIANYGNWATRIFSLDLSGDTVLPYAFAGIDTLNYNILFFETQGAAENYSSIVWTTSGDGTFITNNAEHVTYLRGPGDLDSGQVILTMHLTGYYQGTEAADSMILYLLPVGIEDNSDNDLAFQIFPNPTGEYMTLQAKAPMDEPLTIHVTGNDGRILFTGRYVSVNEYFELRFDVSYLPSGIYFVKLLTTTGKMVKKLVVQ